MKKAPRSMLVVFNNVYSHVPEEMEAYLSYSHIRQITDSAFDKQLVPTKICKPSYKLRS